MSVVILAGLVSTEPLEAQLPQPQARRDLVRNWLERIQTADEEVRSGAYKSAKRSMDQLLHDMCGRIFGGGGVGEVLGMAAAVRGLAEAGLGNERDARWDWDIAEALAPRFADLDLAAYGTAGELLREKEDETPQQEPDGDAGEEEPGEGARSEGITPPVKLRAPHPKFPGARLVSCLEDVLVARIVIDEEGLAQTPSIVSSPSEVASFAVLDILRKWRFRPAKLHGKPVAVFYNLTVNFQVPYCQDAMARYRKHFAAEGADRD